MFQLHQRQDDSNAQLFKRVYKLLSKFAVLLFLKIILILVIYVHWWLSNITFCLTLGVRKRRQERQLRQRLKDWLRKRRGGKPRREEKVERMRRKVGGARGGDRG